MSSPSSESGTVSTSAPEPPQDLERAVVAGSLDEDLGTGLDVVACDEAEGLERAVRDHHPRDVDVVTVGDPLAKRQVAERRAVVERGRAVAGERGLGAVAELLDRKQIRAGKAAGEGDEAHGTSLLTAAGRRVKSDRTETGRAANNHRRLAEGGDTVAGITGLSAGRHSRLAGRVSHARDPGRGHAPGGRGAGGGPCRGLRPRRSPPSRTRRSSRSRSSWSSCRRRSTTRRPSGPRSTPSCSSSPRSRPHTSASTSATSRRRSARRPRPAPPTDFGDATTDPEAFAEAAATLEDVAVGAYNGQAANLTKAGLRAAATVISVDARHAAWVRAIVGPPARLAGGRQAALSPPRSRRRSTQPASCKRA